MNDKNSRLRVTRGSSFIRWIEWVFFLVGLLLFSPALTWIGRVSAVLFLAALVWDVMCRTKSIGLWLGQHSLHLGKNRLEASSIKRVAMAADGAQFVITENREWRGRTIVYVHKSHRAAAKMRVTAWADANGIEVTRK